MIRINTFFKDKAPVSTKRFVVKYSKKIARKVFPKEVGELNFVFVGKEEIKRVNKKYLNKNKLTDVIAFRYPKIDTVSEKGDMPFGDIFICIPQAQKQAKRFGHDLNDELLVLMAHGVLHLSGMRDYTPKERREMEISTEKLLKKI
jgi:probable rRNA maturation factor